MMHRTPLTRFVATVLVAPLVVALAACGDDDTTAESATTETTDIGGERACEPVGEDLEADATSTVELDLTDFAFDPAAIEIEAGTITFATTNAGENPHELAFLPGGGDVPFTEGGEPDEAALEAAGAFELEAYDPGQSCNATYALEPGTYTIFCIVEADDGQTHYGKGMAGTVVVS